MHIVFGGVSIAFALGIVALAIIPNRRGKIRWGNPSVPHGVVSHLGFGLFFVGTGLLFFFIGSVSEEDRIWFGLPPLFGFLVGLAGYRLDTGRWP